MRPETEAIVERVRAVCMRFPKVVEHRSVASGVGAFSGTGVVGFTVSRRVVARLLILDPGGRENVVLWFRADPSVPAGLVGSGRGYLRGEVSVVLDDDTDWTEITELVTESYLLMAPKQLAAQVEVTLDVSRDDTFDA